MAVITRWGMGAAVLAAALVPAARAWASPPDLVLETRKFLEGPGVIAPKADNYLYVPTAPQNGRLIVLFPGSSMDHYKSFMTAAAARGYHVLALDSPLTSRGLDDVCGPHATCYGHLLRQAVDGDMTDVPPFWHQDYPQARYPQAKNSITHRLVALLQYLQKEHQGSGQFLLCRDAAACEPDWPKIVVAGHSKGGAVALWLLKRHKGTGMKAFIFSGPSGYLSNTHHIPGVTSSAYATLAEGAVNAPGYIPSDPSWKDDVYILDSASDPRYMPNGGRCALGDPVPPGSPCESGSSYRSVGVLLGKRPMDIPSGITYPACHDMPGGRFLVDTSPGGHNATIEDGDATDAARCAWDRFLILY